MSLPSTKQQHDAGSSLLLIPLVLVVSSPLLERRQSDTFSPCGKRDWRQVVWDGSLCFTMNNKYHLHETIIVRHMICSLCTLRMFTHSCTSVLMWKHFAPRMFTHSRISMLIWKTFALQGVDVEIFSPKVRGTREPRPQRLQGRFVIFSGGKFELRKAQDIAVAAFKAFSQAYPSAKALLMFSWYNPWPIRWYSSLGGGGHTKVIHVCVCVCVCVCLILGNEFMNKKKMETCTDMHTLRYVHTCIHVFVCTCTIRITCIHARAHTCVNTCVHALVKRCIHTYMNPRTHTYAS
jgi:hypothetical protein